jgi:hypothetical protein
VERLKDELKRQEDDLDIARCKANETDKLLATIEKYKQREKEDKKNKASKKELEDANAGLLDQVDRLEAQLKTNVEGKKDMDDQRKEIMELNDHIMKQEAEIEQKTNKADELRDKVNELKEELSTAEENLGIAREKVETLQEDLDSGVGGGASLVDNAELDEYKRKVELLQKENKSLKDTAAAEVAPSQTSTGADDEDNQLGKKVKALEAHLEEAKESISDLQSKLRVQTKKAESNLAATAAAPPVAATEPSEDQKRETMELEVRVQEQKVPFPLPFCRSAYPLSPFPIFFLPSFLPSFLPFSFLPLFTHALSSPLPYFRTLPVSTSNITSATNDTTITTAANTIIITVSTTSIDTTIIVTFTVTTT